MQLVFFAFEQFLFYWCFKAVLLAFRLLFKGIVYSPQLITSYFLCRMLLNKADTALLWLTMIVVIALIIHMAVLLLKQLILGLKNSGNYLWIPLLLAAISYTCIFPVWLVFNPAKNLMVFVSHERPEMLTWLFSIAFGIYLYTRYDFFNLQGK